MTIKNVILYSQTLPPLHVGGIETNAFFLVQYLLRNLDLHLSVLTKTKRKLLLRKRINLKYGDVEFSAHLAKKKKLQDAGSVVSLFAGFGYQPNETVIYHNSLDLYKYYEALANAGFFQVARSGGNDLSFLQKNAGEKGKYCAAFAKLDTLFLNSEYSRCKASEIGLPSGILKVVKGGCIAIGRGHENVKPELGFSQSQPVILSCGRLVDFKGLDDALAALAILKQRGKEPMFVIVGDGPLDQELRTLAEQLGVSENCRFVGKVDPSNVFKYYQAADLYLSSSKDIVRDVDGYRYTHTETMGRSICEAQGCGTPVVVTDAGGSAEMLVRGETGLVVSQSNPAALADALDKLIGDDALRIGMGKAALKYAEESLAWEAVLAEYVGVMRSLA
ncbi:MAG: glycosyltransferase family 4 protein [Pseudomonadota bacterium]|nr:glycosyltransferase family 4 protein [Pseudomonadota bacterium]